MSGDDDDDRGGSASCGSASHPCQRESFACLEIQETSPRALAALAPPLLGGATCLHTPTRRANWPAISANAAGTPLLAATWGSSVALASGCSPAKTLSASDQTALDAAWNGRYREKVMRACAIRCCCDLPSPNGQCCDVALYNDASLSIRITSGRIFDYASGRPCLHFTGRESNTYL